MLCVNIVARDKMLKSTCGCGIELNEKELLSTVQGSGRNGRAEKKFRCLSDVMISTHKYRAVVSTYELRSRNFD